MAPWRALCAVYRLTITRIGGFRPRGSARSAAGHPRERGLTALGNRNPQGAERGPDLWQARGRGGAGLRKEHREPTKRRGHRSLVLPAQDNLGYKPGGDTKEI